jgi:3-hydroxy-9,10-secoandrosta-1,3,5(10)-triene-9,17-dione monooxygenase
MTGSAIDQAVTPPSFEMLKARARALTPGLRARATETEALRRIPDATIAELHKSGLFRMLQPKRVGGSELPYRALIELGAILAEGCGSTSWVVANLASHHWMLAMWPEQAQNEVWGVSPDHLIGSALVFPSGKATAVADGYVLSGRWPFSSGIDPSQWNFVGGIVHDPKGKPIEQRCFLVPARDYQIIDTWYATGLRGTGSKDIEMTDVFVPTHRTLPLSALVGGGDAPGCAINTAPLYKLPVLGLFAFVVSGVSLGLARGAIGDFTQQMHVRNSTYSGRRLADLANLQLKLGEASALADTAEALMLKDCDEAIAIIEDGVQPTIEQKARWRRDGAYAASLCTEAVNLLFAATGGGGVYLDQPIQRAFRDAQAANAHYALNWDGNGTQWGRIALGLPAEAVML